MAHEAPGETQGEPSSQRRQSPSLGNELLVANSQILFFALTRTQACRIGFQGLLLIPMTQDKQRVPDFRTRLAQFDHKPPSLRLALPFAAYATQKVHDGSPLSTIP